MSNKRREFIDRLLRISQINQELLSIGERSRQPAFTKRIKLVQMGKAEFNLPAKPPVATQSKHNCKVLVLDKTPQRYTSECSPNRRSNLYNNSERVQAGSLKSQGNAYKMLLEKRRSEDSYIQHELQHINFVSPIECQIKTHFLKYTEQLDMRQPHSHYKPNRKVATSVKSIMHSQEDNEVYGPSHQNGHNMLSGKSIKLSRSNTLSFDRDRKTEEDRKVKIEKMKQIRKNYAGPFTPPPKITAKSYIICEVGPENMKPIVCFNSKNSQEVASLTKIMTCILTIEIVDRFKIEMKVQQIKIGKYESSIGGTTAEIKAGHIYTVHQLLYGLMLPSGNDASLALAVWGGRKLLENSSQCSQLVVDNTKKLTKGACYTRFLWEMNSKAESLKMAKTKYANSHGLSNPNNRSSAHDISLLSHYAMKSILFREIVSCRSYQATIKFQDGSITTPREGLVQENQGEPNFDELIQERRSMSPERRLQGSLSMKASPLIGSEKVSWENTHKLLQTKPAEYIGIKTGITTTAGPCLSSMVTIENRQFIIVVLACHKTAHRFKETEILKRWLYKHEGLIKKVKRPATGLKSQKAQKATEQGYSDSDSEDRND